MTMAIMQLRLQTLDRQIHKKNCRLSTLQQQLDLMASNYTNTDRLYKQYYLLLNGVGGMMTEEMRQSFNSNLQDYTVQLELMGNKEDSIELEISAIKSELAQDAEEIKNVKKWIEDNAKKETAHYSIS